VRSRLHLPQDHTKTGIISAPMVAQGPPDDVLFMHALAWIGASAPPCRVFALRPDTLAWFATAYALPTTALMPVYGRLGDVLPKREVLAGGLAVFLVGSMVCFLGASPAIVVLGRLLQGLGASGQSAGSGDHLRYGGAEQPG
jgi:MFS family permease